MKRKGYVLCLALAIIFLVSSLLGLAIMRFTSFSDVASVYLTHSNVRGELVSLTNFALKWLSAKLEDGNIPRAEGSAVADAKSLRMFTRLADSGASPERGSVEIFDMSYALSDASPSEDELSLFPPHYPDGYLIRARLAGKGQAALIMENVYLMISGDTPLGGRFYKLNDKPVYSREIFR
ncbi:hypothetical protein FACS1894187_23560 [Synergistales bacterium]|nr:hypothetical protein FACS1894187_23560 [Synergistales bacterium]